MYADKGNPKCFHFINFFTESATERRVKEKQFIQTLKHCLNRLGVYCIDISICRRSREALCKRYQTTIILLLVSNLLLLVN